jgi:hypothetical protein
MAEMRTIPWQVTSVTTGTVAWGFLGTEMNIGLTWRLAFDLVGGWLVGGSALKHRRVRRPRCESAIHLRRRAVVKREARDACTLAARVREVDAHVRSCQ